MITYIPNTLNSAITDIKEVTIEDKIRFYFTEEPEKMIATFTCESRLEQFDINGFPLVSPTDDVGVTQINRKTWHTKAKELNLDYENDIDDNLEMARYVYEVQGAKAWSCYKKLFLS